METRIGRLSSVGLGLGMLALIIGLLLPPRVAAAEIEVGKKVVDGMTVRVWLDEPKAMQMLMKGKWMTYRPKAGALTHHLGIDLTVADSGQIIPGAAIEARLINRATGKQINKKLPAMMGNRFVYGANVRLEPGQYDVVVRVSPPTIMRMESAMNKWQTPMDAKFTFEIK